MRRRAWRCVGLATVLLIVSGVGCAKPRTSRVAADDFDAMSRAMAASLLASDAIADRTPESAPWHVSMTKLVNLSNDVMTDREQWYVMSRIRGAAPITAFQDEKAIFFVLPPEQIEALRAAGEEFEDGVAAKRRVTHTLTGIIRSVTRADAKARVDLYSVNFELLPLAGGVPVWADRFEFKRLAEGTLWD